MIALPSCYKILEDVNSPFVERFSFEQYKKGLTDFPAVILESHGYRVM